MDRAKSMWGLLGNEKPPRLPTCSSREDCTPWTRPESRDVFVNSACTIYTQGGADYAEADCAQADAIYPV